LKSKTRNRVEAGLDLANLAIEEVPHTRAVKKGLLVTRDLYTLKTGRRVKLADLPFGERMDRWFAARERALDRRISRER